MRTLLTQQTNGRQRAPARQSQIEGGEAPVLNEEHHCQRQGRRGRLIWQSRSQLFVSYLPSGLITLFILLMSTFLHAEELEVFKQISDICHPTLDDLRRVQFAMLHDERPILKRLGDKEQIIRNFKIIGDSPDESPVVFEQDVNIARGIKENCAICYSSFNERYPLGCKRLFLRIVHSDFRGHVECRIGGWPDLEAGSLPLAPVPFAFKVCFLKEMQRKGYKRVLWMDASIMPVVSLNQIFKIIEEKGYFIQENSHVLHPPYMDPELAEVFDIPFEKASNLLCCSAAIFGVDFTNEKVCRLIDTWYEAAKHPLAFYSPRSDQTALSVLLYQFGMTDWMPGSILGTKKDFRRSLFYMDREYVK